uniref:Nucleotide-diphospho-sugar transferase domain-containing protein n=1 Tax=viral metagenome TaxID=1070528 RepID=A0A6C0KZU9_9ZZZZ|tara:strand:+ start:15685 stop:16470 length:786 start_codon:yes stop_codon:yes gene_type:complete
MDLNVINMYNRMKICFITTIIADSFENGDVPEIFDKNSNHDYYLFTNLPEKNYINTSWDIIKLNNNEDFFKNIESNIIKSRFIKFMGWKYLYMNMKKKYDMIVYCDATFYPKNKKEAWEEIYELVKEYGIVQKMKYPERTAYTECVKIYKKKKDSQKRSKQMLNFLKVEKLPEKRYITENCYFAYDPTNKQLKEAFEFFWELYQKNITHRDQPLWDYVKWKKNINPYIGTKFFSSVRSTCLFGKLSDLNIGFSGHTYINQE